MEPYYQDDACTIYHGDCRDVLSELAGPVDLLLTDPPYGMGLTARSTSIAFNVKSDGVRQGVRSLRQALFEARGVLAPDAHLLVFCHWEAWPDFYDAVSPFAQIRNALIWHKNTNGLGNFDAEYRKTFEVILYATYGTRGLTNGTASAVLEGFPSVHPKERGHPTEKPTDLLGWLIAKHSPEGGTVLDPFMGSGSTLRAAKNLGRRAVGIEMDERYCEFAARRLGQGVLDLGGAA